MKKYLIVLTGPTGDGKTEVCLHLADFFKIPVINADSRQIFKEIPIGTAAPTPLQQSKAKHYFVGTHSIDDYYSASVYEEEAMRIIGEIHKTSDIALLSGGSMMYIDAVCNGIDDIPTVPEDIRENLKRRLADEGLPALVEQLRQLDPVHWAIVDRNNPRRVVHALEICLATGKTYTSFRTHQKKQRPFNIVKIGLNRPREELYERINARVLKMIDKGLEQEARTVFPLRHLNSLNTVGYKELFAYFDDRIPKEEAIRQIQSNTRQYMRKQLTWFKKDDAIQWFSPDNIEDILKYIDSVS